MYSNHADELGLEARIQLQVHELRETRMDAIFKLVGATAGDGCRTRSLTSERLERRRDRGRRSRSRSRRGRRRRQRDATAARSRSLPRVRRSTGNAVAQELGLGRGCSDGLISSRRRGRHLCPRRRCSRPCALRPTIILSKYRDRSSSRDRRCRRRPRLRAVARRRPPEDRRGRRRADGRQVRGARSDRPERRGLETLRRHRHRRGDPGRDRRPASRPRDPRRADPRREATAARRHRRRSALGRFPAEAPADAARSSGCRSCSAASPTGTCT